MVDNKRILALDIWADIQSHLFSYFLLLLVVCSSFAVVYCTHINRQTTSELEVLLSQRDELDIEWRNLLLEQNRLALHSAIESKAEKLLNMNRPSAQSEIIVRLP